MSRATRLKNRLIAKAVNRLPGLARKVVAGYTPPAVREEPPWAPIEKPLTESRIAVVTTAGIHHRHQLPFDMQDPEGDPTWRALDTNSLFSDFRITHDYYDHRAAEQDPNIILPLDRLREFVAEGRIGELAATQYGFMGHIVGRHLTTLTGQTAPEVAGYLVRDQIDVVLLTPA